MITGKFNKLKMMLIIFSCVMLNEYLKVEGLVSIYQSPDQPKKKTHGFYGNTMDQLTMPYPSNSFNR